jgi:hypothetical protein
MALNRLAGLVALGGLSVVLVSCQRPGASRGAAAPIVGAWSGSACTLNARGEREKSGTVSLEFHFQADGTCRVGKAKTWVEGTYRFLDDGRFEMKAGKAFAGVYEIVESGPGRLVYERQLGGGRRQRTELTR